MSSNDDHLIKCAPYGVIRHAFAIKRETLINCHKLGPKWMTGNVFWTSTWHTTYSNGVQQLSFFVHCDCVEEGLDDWDVRGSLQSCIVNHLDKDNSYAQCYISNFNVSRPGRSFYACNIADISDDERGFLKDDELIVELEIRVTEVKGVNIARIFNLTDVTPHTVSLNIGTVQLNVNARLIAFHSPYFANLLDADYDDSFYELSAEKTELLIQCALGARPKQLAFYNPLGLIVEPAHKFKLFNVVRRCEEWLLFETLSNSWLDYAVKYDMRRLFCKLMSKWSSKEKRQEGKTVLRAINVEKMSLEIKRAFVKNVFEHV
ncbi:unnamed protein product [Caenorhabditis sp. 36 PRJEB53466]|nr:unnamed protein product [Caenorhabditis sp. 36 PRJEB53466]